MLVVVVAKLVDNMYTTCEFSSEKEFFCRAEGVS